MTKSLLLSLLVWALAGALGAEAVGLTELFEAAKRRSERLGQAEAARRSASAVQSEAVGEWLPQLTLKGSELFSDQGNTALQSPAWRLNARQELLKGLDQPAALKAGAALEAQAQALARQAEQDLARDLGGAYFNVLSLEEQISVERGALENAEAAVKELTQRVALGRNRRAELSSSQAQAARVRAALAVLEGRLAEARLGLASLSGLPVDQAYAPPAPADAQSAPPAPQEGPALQAARQALRLAQARRLGVQGGFLPTLFAEGNWHLARQDNAPGAAWDAQLGLDLPIFQGGAQRARLTQAGAALRSAELAVALAEREERRERDQADAALGLAEARVLASEQALEAAEKSWADQQRDFRNSLVSSLDLLRAFDALESARLDAANARWDAHRARLRRRLAHGSLQP